MAQSAAFYFSHECRNFFQFFLKFLQKKTAWRTMRLWTFKSVTGYEALPTKPFAGLFGII